MKGLWPWLESAAAQRLLLGGLLASMAFVLSPARPPSGLPISMPLYGVLFALLIVPWLVRRPRLRPLDGFAIGLLGLGGWMALASIFSRPRSLELLMLWQSGIVLALYSAHGVRRVFDHTYVRRALAGVAVLQVVVCLVQLAVYVHAQPTVAPDFFSWLFPSRVGENEHVWRFVTGAPGLPGRLTVAPGTFWTVNLLGAWMAITLPILLGGVRAPRGHARGAAQWFYLALTAAAFLVVARNLTRTTIAAAIVGLGVFGALWLLATPRRAPAGRWARWLPWLAIPLLAVTIFAAVDARKLGLVSGTIRGRVIELLREDAGLRLRLTKAGVLGIAQRPLLGWGHGNYNQAMPRTVNLVQGLSERKERAFGDRPDKRLSAHNAYLIVAHDAGLPALGFLALTLAVTIRDFWRRRGRWQTPEIALAASLLAALFTCLFYASMYKWLWPYFMFVLGCLRGETEKARGDGR